MSKWQLSALNPIYLMDCYAPQLVEFCHRGCSSTWRQRLWRWWTRLYPRSATENSRPHWSSSEWAQGCLSMWWIEYWIVHDISLHDDVIKWKHFPRYWPFVRGIHRSPVNSPHKGQWRGALMFTWICARINGWVNNGEAGDLRRYRAHYDVIVM